MATYTLNVVVDFTVLERRPSDNLCIARRVNDVYNTVLHGASVHAVGRQESLLANNTFKWSDQFKVFCVMNYKPLQAVNPATNLVEIDYGQEAKYSNHLMDSAQVAERANFSGGDSGKGSADDSFIVARVPSTLRAACACKADDATWQPVFVDPGTHPTVNDEQITPSNQYVIFWDELLTPTHMFRYIPSPEKFEFSFDDKEFTKSIRFGYGSRDKPVDDEEARFRIEKET